MRNALKMVVLGFALTFVCLPRANAVDVASSSVYATPVYAPVNSLNVVPQEGDPGLLRASTNDIPPATSVDQTANSAATPAVEAIPTPTAFNAGLFLLVIIFVGRCIRKIRWE